MTLEQFNKIGQAEANMANDPDLKGESVSGNYSNEALDGSPEYEAWYLQNARKLVHGMDITERMATLGEVEGKDEPHNS
jgi:hypothetical protein